MRGVNIEMRKILFLFVFCGLSSGYYGDFSYWGNKGYSSTDPDEQIECYTKALEKWSYSDGYENKAIAYYSRGLAYYDKGEYDRAIEDYNKAIELNPEYTYAYNNRGLAYYNKGEYERAKNDFEKAMELDPEDEYPVANMGEIYFQRGEFSSALEWLNKALNMKDESDVFNSVFYKKILIYKEQKNKEFIDIVLDKAEKYIKNQIKKYPKKAFNYLDLAEIYCEAEKKIDEAKKLVEEGFKLKKDYYAYYVSGRVYIASHQNEKAVKELKKAIELNPSHIWSYYWLGKIYFYRLKDSQNARYYYEQGLKINPNFRLIKKELGKLK